MGGQNTGTRLKWETTGKRRPDRDKIYSISTMTTYLDRIKDYCRWVKRAHPEIQDLDDAYQYVIEYLLQRLAEGIAAHTIHTDAAALAKLFQVSVKDLGGELPRRRRAAVKNHRRARPGQWNPERHKEFIALCLACGLRRCELVKLKPEHVWQMSGGTYIFVPKGKNGKRRAVRCLSDLPMTLAQQAKREGREVHVLQNPA